MEDEHEILLSGGVEGERAVITEEEVGETCKLTCSYRGKAIYAEAPDFFEALCLIRRQLEPEGLIPLCYGASLNVYPSGMARDMGAGLKAYRLAVGQPARRADLVQIFETGPDVIPASVDDQASFFDGWLASIRG